MTTGEYVGSDGAAVNSIANFWRHLKKGIRGTHISVTSKYLESYAKEFKNRFNPGGRAEAMLSEPPSFLGKPGA